MKNAREDWITNRAYALWEEAGRPHGQDHEHWQQAVRERDELERVALPGYLNGTSDHKPTSAKGTTAKTKAAKPEKAAKPSSKKEKAAPAVPVEIAKAPKKTPVAAAKAKGKATKTA